MSTLCMIDAVAFFVCLRLGGQYAGVVYYPIIAAICMYFVVIVAGIVRLCSTRRFIIWIPMFVIPGVIATGSCVSAMIECEQCASISMALAISTVVYVWLVYLFAFKRSS